MRLSNRVVLCLLVLALPLGASAAVATLKVRDVIAIIQANKKPLAFDVTARGTMGDGSATLQITGTQNGDMKSLAKAAAEVTFVLDAKADADTSGHAKVRGILVDQTVYLRLDAFTTTGDWASYAEEIDEVVGRWFSIPVDADEYNAYIKAEQENRRTSTKEIEAFFSIVKEELRGTDKTRYTVTIPKNKQRRLVSKIFDNSSSYVRGTSIDFTLTVETARKVFSSLASTLKVTSKVNGDAAKFTLTGKANILKTAPAITAPSESTPWKEFQEQRYGNTVTP